MLGIILSMEITHTHTESVNALPGYMLPGKMEWVVYKAGELLPNGRIVSADYLKTSTVNGFIKGRKRRKYNDGYYAKMDVPDYLFHYNERSSYFEEEHGTSIEIAGSTDESGYERFKIEFSSLAERDDFISNVLKAAVGSKPAG